MLNLFSSKTKLQHEGETLREYPSFYFFSRTLLKIYREIIEIIESVKPDDNTKKVKQKVYKSIVRSRAFYLMILHKNGKIGSDVLESKTKIIKKIEDDFKHEYPKPSGRTVYECLKTVSDNIYNKYEEMKSKHSEDYEYGLKLYKQKHPD